MRLPNVKHECYGKLSVKSFLKITGLHAQKVHTSLGPKIYANPIVVCSCIYPFCLKIAIRPKYVHFGVHIQV